MGHPGHGKNFGGFGWVIINVVDNYLTIEYRMVYN
jgi:hypothetical protein